MTATTAKRPKACRMTSGAKATPTPNVPAVAEFLKTESVRWRKLVREANREAD